MEYLLIPLCLAIFAGIYVAQKKQAAKRASADSPQTGADSADRPAETTSERPEESLTPAEEELQLTDAASGDGESAHSDTAQAAPDGQPDDDAALPEEDEPIDLGAPAVIALGAAPVATDEAVAADNEPVTPAPVITPDEPETASGPGGLSVKGAVVQEDISVPGGLSAPQEEAAGAVADSPSDNQTDLESLDFSTYEDLTDIMPDHLRRLERLRERETKMSALPGFAQSEYAMRNKLDQGRALYYLAQKEQDPARCQTYANEAYGVCLQAFGSMQSIREDCLELLSDCLNMQASFKSDAEETAAVYINGASLYATADKSDFALLGDERILDNFTQKITRDLNAMFADSPYARQNWIYSEENRLANLKGPYESQPEPRFSLAFGHQTNDLWRMKQYEGMFLARAGALLPEGEKRREILDYAAKVLTAHSSNYPFDFHISTLSARQITTLIDNLEEFITLEAGNRDVWIALALTYKARDKDLEGYVAKFWLDRAMHVLDRAMKHIKPDLFVVHHHTQFLLTTLSADLGEWWDNASRARLFILNHIADADDKTVIFGYYNLLTQNIVQKLMLLQKFWRELPESTPAGDKAAAAHANMLESHPDWGSFNNKQKEARAEYMLIRNSMAEETYTVISTRDDSSIPVPAPLKDPKFGEWEEFLADPAAHDALSASSNAAEQLIWTACSIPPLAGLDYNFYMNQPEEMGVFWSNNASTATSPDVENLLCAISSLYLLYSARCFGVNAEGGDHWPLLLRDLIFSRNNPELICKVLAHGGSSALAAAQRLEPVAGVPEHLLAGLYYYSGECLRMQAWYADQLEDKDQFTLRQEAEELYDQADSILPGCTNYSLAALAAADGKADMASSLLANASASYGKTKVYMSIDRDLATLPLTAPAEDANAQSAQ